MKFKDKIKKLQIQDADHLSYTLGLQKKKSAEFLEHFTQLLPLWIWYSVHLQFMRSAFFLLCLSALEDRSIHSLLRPTHRKSCVSKWVVTGKCIRRTYTIFCYEFCGMQCLNSILLYLSRLPCSFHIDFGTVKFKELIFLVMFHPIPANVSSLVSSMTWIQRYDTYQLYFLLALHKFSLDRKSVV